MALSLVLALTLVLALVQNIIIFSKVRILVLNQPINSGNWLSQDQNPHLRKTPMFRSKAKARVWAKAICGCPAAPWCRWYLAGQPDPDPASGSAHVSSRQAPYEGSDRQARGRVLAALTAGGSVRSAPDDPIVAGLAADGLVVVDDLGVRLPD